MNHYCEISLSHNPIIVLQTLHIVQLYFITYHLFISGNIAPSLSVLSNAITTTCHRHDDDDAHLMDQSELLDLNHPSLCVWQVEVVSVCVYVLLG